MRIQVKDFMSSPVTVVIADTSIADIRQIMDHKKIHAIPIVEYDKKFPKIETKILGIITISDLNKKLPSDSLVKDIMPSHLVHIVHKDSSAQAAARMLLKHKVHHLIVMEDGDIIGIVSSMDFVRLVSEHELK